MKLVVVCGSRDWDDEATIREALERLIPKDPEADWPTILHGGARGADQIAGRIALELGFWVEEMRPDYDQHGRGATFKRNQAMVDEGPQVVLAFQKNGSRGTQDTIDRARERRCLVEIYPA